MVDVSSAGCPPATLAPAGVCEAWRLGQVRPAARAGGSGGLFERFTDRARRVVVQAQEEARVLSHNFIGTEHLLLGLIHEGEGMGAKALEGLGIGLAAVRQQVEQMISPGEEPPRGHIPFTPQAKRALELSLRESRQLGHTHIGTEHILLGLIREGEGVAAQVLVRMGADLQRARHQVIQLLPGPNPVPSRTVPRGSQQGQVPPHLAARVDALESRLSAIEQRVGGGPDTGDLDEQITRVRQDKAAAIDAQDFERAASVHDREKQLLADKAARQHDWQAGHPGLAEQVHRLSGELERLRGVLRQHGIDDPQDNTDDPQDNTA
jgi:hypothetical protein